jgi:hypothetical protein
MPIHRFKRKRCQSHQSTGILRVCLDLCQLTTQTKTTQVAPNHRNSEGSLGSVSIHRFKRKRSQSHQSIGIPRVCLDLSRFASNENDPNHAKTYEFLGFAWICVDPSLQTKKIPAGPKHRDSSLDLCESIASNENDPSRAKASEFPGFAWIYANSSLQT